MKRVLFILLIALLLLTACGDGGSHERDVTPISASSTSSPSIDNSRHTLNAGEIDDNSQFTHYLSYRSTYPQQSSLVRDMDVSRRQIITVVDTDGLPVHDARVLIYEEQELLVESRTYADGRTLFFPDIWSQSSKFNAIVQKDEIAVTFEIDIQFGPQWIAELSNINQQRDTVQLDIVFLLDATGSMADEIRQLQDNILRISSEIDNLPNNIDTRYGLVHYRDRGDAYITKHSDFVRDIQEFQNALNQVQAGGGGDNPESLNEGLHEAVQSLSWRNDNTIKLIFLVADAPPHLDYANDYDYSKEIVAAAWQGIKIHPIASSGLPSNGEYIFRQIAQYTMGHFIFLTYERGTSGTAGTERTDLEAGQAGNYSVDQLDDLVLRLINDEIAAREKLIDRQDAQTQLAGTPLQPNNPIPPDIASLASDNNPDFVLMLIMLLAGGVVFSTGLIVFTGQGKRKKAKRTMQEPGIYE